MSFHHLTFGFAAALGLAALAPLSAAGAEPPPVRVSTVATNGMPKNIVPNGAVWNFGPGSPWTHLGWQYVSYWDDARQVSVARRQLPDGAWAVASLPDYQRTSNVNRGKGGTVSRGFGDSHEKVALGISPDGVIHLAFDHHVSTLHYRTSRQPVAANPAAHAWSAELFGPVTDHLGGPPLADVTYPAFTTDGTAFALYLRLGGGSGNANSHFFAYEAGRWLVNTTAASRVIDRAWSGGDGTVNAYPHGLVFAQGRRHLTWCWRDTPVASTSHDLCYAYSDDGGRTWRNNDGREIGRAGARPITADSPGVSVWPIPAGTRYVNGGSMTVDSAGRVHVLVRGEDGSPALFRRDPAAGRWTHQKSSLLGTLVAGAGDQLYLTTTEGLYRVSAYGNARWEKVAGTNRSLFKDSSMGTDRLRAAHDGWVSVVGQNGRTVTVVDYWVGR